MKFVISSSLLLSHLQTVGRVIGSKNSMPILENILFIIKGNELTLRASDGDNTLETKLTVDNATGSGKFCVPAKTLLDPLKELPEQPLTVEVNDASLEIVIYFLNGKYNFMGVNGDEYPNRRKFEKDAVSFNISAPALLSGVTRTLFAASDEELRKVMTGVFFDIRPDQIVFVATDSHKLVRLRNLSVQSGMTASFILPKKPASLLKGILPKEPTNVAVSFDSSSALFRFDSIELNCRLIEGRFPNYEAVIPSNLPNKLVIDRQMLINVLRRVSVFANPATALVSLRLENNTIVASTQDIDFSTSAVENIACSYDGNPMSIGFSATTLVEVLSFIASAEVLIELADSTRPGILTPVENAENEDLLMMLMPMMLQD
jgi:DNA polymerase-3 subunit beta